jgi:hypothetical protein
LRRELDDDGSALFGGSSVGECDETGWKGAGEGQATIVDIVNFNDSFVATTSSTAKTAVASQDGQRGERKE